MKSNITVNCNGITYLYSLNDDCFPTRIELTDKFIIDVFKSHNHRYYFNAFFYTSKRMYVDRQFRTKKLLVGAIQLLLHEELTNV